MTYSANELAGGAPYELYEFTHGIDKYLYTSARESVVFGGFTYEPIALERKSIEANDESTNASITLELPHDNAIAILFKNPQPPKKVLLSVYRKHRGDTETVTVFKGEVTNAGSESESIMTLNCEATQSKLARTIPAKVIQVTCNHQLYDAGCKVVRATYTVASTVTVINADLVTLTVPAASGQANGYYKLGDLVVTAPGVANGARRMIVSHTTTTIIILSKIPGLQVGDAVTISAGCEKTNTVCIAKFNNIVNFWGFPALPTKDPFKKIA